MVDYTKMSCIIGCKENKYITYFPPIKCWLCDSHRHLREILEQNLNYKKVEVATRPGGIQSRLGADSSTPGNPGVELVNEKSIKSRKQILDIIGIEINKLK